MDTKQEFKELENIKYSIETSEFQKYIIKPLYDELDALKGSYDCESLRELATIKGKKQGLKWLIERLKQINSDYENKKFELTGK